MTFILANHDEGEESMFSGEAYNGYVHVCATAPDTAPASSLRRGPGVASPSGVKYLRTDSYVMKLRPT